MRAPAWHHRRRESDDTVRVKLAMLVRESGPIVGRYQRLCCATGFVLMLGTARRHLTTAFRSCAGSRPRVTLCYIGALTPRCIAAWRPAPLMSLASCNTDRSRKFCRDMVCEDRLQRPPEPIGTSEHAPKGYYGTVHSLPAHVLRSGHSRDTSGARQQRRTQLSTQLFGSGLRRLSRSGRP